MRQEMESGIPTLHVFRSPLHANPFTDAHWAQSSRAREAVDGLGFARRWRVTVLPADGSRRTFYLCGSFAAVRARAAALWPPQFLHVVLIESAPEHGGEVIDARLSLSL